MTYEAKPITDKMIKDEIEFDKSEYNKITTYDEAKARLEALRNEDCLLYDDCRSCPLDRKCPVLL